MNTARAIPASRDGFVLIAVLSVMALLSGIAVMMLVSSRNAIETAAIASDTLKMDAMIQSGMSIAAYQLFVLKAPADKISGQQIRLDQGTITLTVTTDAGKADLNTSSAKLLAAAYQASGLMTLTPQSFGARVVDWRDADDTTSDDGAETADYKAIGLTYGPGNRPFRSLGDLRWVPGVSAADIAALAGLVTIYNPRGRLDAFSAPSSLVGALPGVDAETVAEIIATRKTRTAASIAKLTDLLLVQSSLIDEELPNSYRVTLYIQPAGTGRSRGVEAVLTSGLATGSAFQVLHYDVDARIAVSPNG
jgi:general secretion pathway protein K